MRSRFLCMTVALASLVGPAIGAAAPICPPEVTEAKDLLKTKSAVAQRPRSQAGARGQETQGPRGQEIQAPRGQETQAPRGQEIQAPRGQETQAPRGQEIQAPRGQEVQAPRTKDHPEPPTTPASRGQDIQAPRNVAKGRTTALANARKLVSEAEMACKDGDSARATSNARAAMELLRYLP